MGASRNNDGARTVKHRRTLQPSGAWSALTGSTRWMVVALTLALVAAAVHFVADVGMRSVLLVLGPFTAAAAIIDFRTHRIPTWLAVASGSVALCACIALAIDGRSWTPLFAGLAAGATVGILYLALWRFTGLGLGDVRLTTALAPITGTLGWQTVVAFVVLTHLVAVPFALWALARRRRDVPFGPAIVGGLYLAVALAPLL